MRVDLTTSSDASLAMSVARWEEDALAEIYRRYAAGLLGLARRLLSDARLAEDVLQEVFVRFWNRPQRFDPDRGSLRAFLAAETHGRAVDLLRADEARRRREAKDALRAPITATIEHEVVETMLADHVRVAVAELPETERKAVELAYFGGLTYREVATVLNEPEGTVKSRIRKALQRLETALIDLRDREAIR
ncbi:MAG: RNA polymerase sigma factor [Acidimicrobiales bacterium]